MSKSNKTKKVKEWTTLKGINYEFIQKARKDKVYRKNFEDWFIGFSEGCGKWQHFKDKGPYGQFQFIIRNRDPKLLLYIKAVSGFGIVQGPYFTDEEPRYFLASENPRDLKSRGRYYAYKVKKTNNLRRLFGLFNGRIALHQTKKDLKACLNIYNKASPVIEKNLKIPYIDDDFEPSLDNAWLSGLFDGIGQFRGGFLGTDLTLMRLGWEFHLSGREKEVGQKLVETLEGSHLLLGKSYKRKKPVNPYNKTWIVSAYRRYPSSILINYLQKFKLRGPKQITFKRFVFCWIKLYHKDHRFYNYEDEDRMVLGYLIHTLNWRLGHLTDHLKIVDK